MEGHGGKLTFHDTNCRDATHWGMFPATFVSGIQQGRSRPLDANCCYELSIIPSFLQLETVQRTLDPFHSFLRDVRVTFRRLYAAMPQQLLNVPNVYAILQ